MSKYRQRLPQLQDELFLTDGGIETTLIFHHGATLPYFASFVLLQDESGTTMLRRYFERYAELAPAEELGLVLETPTWRANPDWAAKLPVAISFTIETDGRLPSGATLAEAIGATDEASGGYPAYYMINCAHPTHVALALDRPGEWRDRIRGLRANASRRSHTELDESPDLDAGYPEELGREYQVLGGALRNLSVVGGCCGTDHRHVAAIARAMQPARARAWRARA